MDSGGASKGALVVHDQSISAPKLGSNVGEVVGRNDGVSDRKAVRFVGTNVGTAVLSNPFE